MAGESIDRLSNYSAIRAFNMIVLSIFQKLAAYCIGKK